MENTLRETLTDWTDWDWAAFYLAVALGLMPNDSATYFIAKGVFWSNNPLGNLLYKTLEGLVEQGILETREEPDNQFRWNPSYHGYWEKAP